MMEFTDDNENTNLKRERSLSFEESGSKRRHTEDKLVVERQTGSGEEVCKDYLRGMCDRGSSCKFSHVPDREVCFDFLVGRCSRRPSACKFFHDYDQAKEREMKRNGARCRDEGGADGSNRGRTGYARVIYEDGTEEWVERERIKPNERERSRDRDSREVCHDYQRGICGRGRTCKFRHVIETCREYSVGACRRGLGCKFSHDLGGRRSSLFDTDRPVAEFRYPLRRDRGASPEREACKDFSRGDCRRGFRCRFSHPDADDGWRGSRDDGWATSSRGRNWAPPREWSPLGDRFRGSSRGPVRDWGRVDYDRDFGRRRGRIEVCNDFQRGKCDRGRTCKFSHEVEVCRQFQRGQCSRGSSCKYHHPPKETCYDYTQGRCTRGEDCRYSHDLEGRELCNDFTRGKCKRGDTCKFLHQVDEVKETCIDFTKGKCLRRDTCKYSHNVEEE